MYVCVLLGTYNTCTYIHMCLCTHTFTFWGSEGGQLFNLHFCHVTVSFAVYSGVGGGGLNLICISVMRL